MKRKENNDGDYVPGKKLNEYKKRIQSPDSGEITNSENEELIYNSNLINIGEEKKLQNTNSHLKNSMKKKKTGDEENWDESSDNIEELLLDNKLILPEELIKDENDRARLSTMTEREREEELFRRAEEIEVAVTRKKITQSLLKSKHMNSNNKMDNINTSTLMEDRDNTPPLNSQTNGIQNDNHNKPPPFKVSELFGDGDNEDELWEAEESFIKSSKINNFKEEDENYEGHEGCGGVGVDGGDSDEVIKGIEELESIRLSRFKLEKWIHMPFFDKRIPGFFVRINIGSYKNNNIYRIAQIVGIKEQDTVYNINSSKTNKVLRLRQCNQERNYRIEFVSNQPFTQNEYEKWNQLYKAENQNLPRTSEINEKLEDLEYCKNYHLSDADITLVVKEKQKFNQTPINYAMTKKTLISEIEQARVQSDQNKVKELQKKLDHVIEEANVFYEKQNERDRKFREIGEKNRLKDLNEREKIIEEEMKANKKKDDPFTRRRTQPKLIRFSRSATLKPELKQQLLDKKNKKNESKVEEEKNIEITEAANKSNKELYNEEILPDLHKLHDFEIDIDIDSLL